MASTASEQQNNLYENFEFRITFYQNALHLTRMHCTGIQEIVIIIITAKLQN